MNEHEEKAPERLWLQVDESAFAPDGIAWNEVTWCRDNVNSTDVEYVRADSVQPLPLPAKMMAWVLITLAWMLLVSIAAWLVVHTILGIIAAFSA